MTSAIRRSTCNERLYRAFILWLTAVSIFSIFSGTGQVRAQVLRGVTVANGKVVSFRSDSDKEFAAVLPFVSYDIGEKHYRSDEKGQLDVSFSPETNILNGVLGVVGFKNSGKDTVRLTNVVPFGTIEDGVYISGLGNHPLSRSHLFRGKQSPVNVILPDNAWELGYSSRKLSETESIAALTRRDVGSITKGARRRFETILYPGGSVNYRMYAELFQGEWQDGLRVMFEEKKLYDVASFDESLYQREDLKWIRGSYVIHLMMAWDKDFYDPVRREFNLDKFVKRGKTLYGGDDAVCIWPTWPSLGIDQRNQFDLYRDLPGGLPGLKHLADTLRKTGTRFFIAYNPWDESTRSEGHLQGLAKLIAETSADGVVLDTKGESSKELQAAADEVRKGIVMYSEGMAVVKDMPGIVAGRVHNALYYPPMLNLNKVIRQDFSIFRVTELFKEPVQREFAVAFFNGYGTEINQFAPGHPEWEEKQYRYLGKTSMILRENSDVFVSSRFTPLVETLSDSIWVNRWAGKDKTIYTVYSLKASGFNQSLVEVTPDENMHFVDLWHHEEIDIKQKDGHSFLPVHAEPFEKTFLGTNNEGQNDCVAAFRRLIKYTAEGNKVSIAALANAQLRIYAGNPSYENQFQVIDAPVIDLHKIFGRYEGKFVIQAFNSGHLMDEVVFVIKPGTPRLISVEGRSAHSASRNGMVKIPAGKFTFRTTHGDEFISYPTMNEGKEFDMSGFLVDKYPVTNEQFQAFIKATGYRPSDTLNFLRHWRGGVIPSGQQQYPVVFISYEDAQAYAKWAGKRLPTEVEWQYASQTPALNEWPWNQRKPVERKEQFVNETLTVTAITGIAPGLCNLGDGKPKAVGSYKKGANPFGLEDLVGSVWQLTNDVYESGSYRYIIMKGGSYFKPSSSWWYVQGGPRELHYRQYLLRVSEGFERNGTVGFRCAADGE